MCPIQQGQAADDMDTTNCQGRTKKESRHATSPNCVCALRALPTCRCGLSPLSRVVSLAHYSTCSYWYKRTNEYGIPGRFTPGTTFP